MQIAVITDIHGNKDAFDSTLREIEKLGVEEVICLGDVVNPFPASRNILEKIIAKNIPMIRGNHEDYIIRSFHNVDDDINTKIQFRPIKRVAQSFNENLVNLMKALPLKISCQGGSGASITFCHASPESNTVGWKFGINEKLRSALKNEPASTLVCGHWHDPETLAWEERTLITVGSVGLPLLGKSNAYFAVCEASNNGWKVEHLAVPFDSQKEALSYLRSGWFEDGGPFARLLMAELVTAERCVSSFFSWISESKRSLESDQDWDLATRDYLQFQNLWESLDFVR